MKYTSYVNQTLLQTALIILIACIAGFSVNHFRADRLALTGDKPDKSESASNTGNDLEISLQKAKELCLANQAVFLDARSPGEYEAGHIQDAKNLPVDEFDNYFDWLIREIPEDKTIITYCDGKACRLSEDLAMLLKDLGYKNVHVLVNGWSLWVENQYPTDKKEGVSKS